MTLVYSERFIRALREAPPEVQRAFLKQARFLVEDFRHPSLQSKKYDEGQGLWQARVNRSWRFYFTIEGDLYRLQGISPHPK